MRSTFDVLRLLHSLGYRYARLSGFPTYEDGCTVVLFHVPHGQGRRAFTAFISEQKDRPPRVEVEPGFVVQQGR
jgi:hypothetical protein